MKEALNEPATEEAIHFFFLYAISPQVLSKSYRIEAILSDLQMFWTDIFFLNGDWSRGLGGPPVSATGQRSNLSNLG